MKRIYGMVAVMVLCVMAGAGLVGCNTFRGAGKDIQSGGKAVENAADDVQNDQRNRDVRPYTIVATAQGGGSISPSGNVDAARGSNQTFRVRASDGYRVADVLVDGRSVGAVDRYTFNYVAESHTISALFNAYPSR